MDSICYAIYESASADEQFYTVDTDMQMGLDRDFRTGINHEVRTALNAIMGFAQIMNEHEISTEDMHSFSNIICQQSEYILHIFNKVLDNYHDLSAR